MIVIPRASSPRPISPDPREQRASVVSSSAASFQTAPSRSASSSAHTLNPASAVSYRESQPSPDVNPIHILSQSAAGDGSPQEVHIIKVTDDQVQFQSGTPPSSLLHKVGASLLRVVPNGNARGSPQSMDDEESFNAGPPPPSPPASEGHTDTFSAPSPMKPSLSDSSVTFDLPRPHHLSFSSSQASTSNSVPGPGQATLARASTDSKYQHPPHGSTSTLSTIHPRISTAPDGDAHDGLLHPPALRPSRRNTTGSTPRTPRLGARAQHSQHTLPPDAEEVSGELASDIQQQAEQIRRERHSKRAKALQELESGGEGALVGNIIGEGHANYVLMYNMLTGIRIAVSRYQAKIKRSLTDEDFTARHKYSFDIIGNELTPSAKYDFKFKDYAPWVFRDLREDFFHLDPADYLLSLTAKYILSELGSPGKSGSFFYFSRDYRFIIKTIHRSEHKFLRSILKRYHEHVKANPHTLLSRFYGLHRVKLPRGRKIHFVIMNNLFPAHKDIHETYDLKGSTVGRLYSEEKAKQNPRAVLKDLNWIERGKSLELGPEKRALLTEQLRRDSDFLKELGVMDYSLLIGIHNMRRGNRDNLRRNTLKVFSPDVPPFKRQPTSSRSPEAIAIRRAMRRSDLQHLSDKTIQLPEEDTGDRQEFIFYQDEGGLRATDEQNDSMDKIYYLGVIDILTPYTMFKKIEHIWKGIQADRHKISPVPPAEYADRFFNFMKAVMRGGGGGARFKSE